MPSLHPDLERWSRPERTPAITATIAASFAERARANPSSTAIVTDGRTMRFGELQAMAERAAAGLHRLGVCRGDLIGVYCRRSPELVAVILGIWRCGAVYVPLDPKYPSQRLQAILADAAPALVVCDAPLPPRLSTQNLKTCCVTEVCAAPVDAGSAAPSMAGLDDRAVVLYTSGSTGTPKGAVLTHRNLANHNAYVIRAFGLTPADRRTAVCSINFDASLEEFFCTLNAGATLVLAEADTLDSFDRFVRFLDRHRITALFMPTSLWRELVNYLHAARREFPPSIRLIDIGGERVTRPMYERFLQVGGRRIRWINVYGPTECSVYATTYEHDPVRDAATNDPPPIGRPIDNVRLFVLGRDGRPSAPGEPGELYIGGAGVGEGYLNRPDMTAERYVDRPCPELPPGRYYRTGDQVRFRADGQLEYVGRLDNQIKLRGFRIEPGEIEAVLQRHPTVRDAAVAVRTSTLGTPYLAAYVVLHPGATWDARALTLFCNDRLPEYMVPRAFVELDVLPQSPNGKVDRTVLPEPCFDEPAQTDALTDEAREPTELERRLLAVWREALEVDDLDVHDDFFVLGGDSLRAMTLAAKLEEALGRAVPAALLMTAPTVALLAAELEKPVDAETDSLVLLRDGDRGRPLFFVHSLGGDVWIYRELVQLLQIKGAVYGLQLPGLGGADAPVDETMEACAAEHVRRMQSVQPHGPYRLAGYSSGGMLAYEIARQLADVGETVEFLGLIDAGVPPACEVRLNGTSLKRLTAIGRQLPIYWRELRAMPSAERRKRILRVVGRCGRRLLPQRRSDAGASPLDDRAWLSCFAEDISFFSENRLRQIKRHFDTVFRYVPQAWEGAAHLFRLRRQPWSSVPTPTLGWEHFLGGPIEVYYVDGSHDSMMQMPHVERLAATISAALEPSSRSDDAEISGEAVRA